MAPLFLRTVREGRMAIGTRVLNGIERIGNKLPDPVFLFLWLIGALIVLSLVGAGLGWSAVNPVTGDTLVAEEPALARESGAAVHRHALDPDRLPAARDRGHHHLRRLGRRAQRPVHHRHPRRPA